jgi:hypothetical protein
MEKQPAKPAAQAEKDKRKTRSSESKPSERKSPKYNSSPLQMLNLAAKAKSRKGKTPLLLEEQEALQELSSLVSKHSKEVQQGRHKPKAENQVTHWLREASDLLLQWVPIILSAVAIL